MNHITDNLADEIKRNAMLKSDHKTFVSLQTPYEFSFKQALVYLKRSPKECLHYVLDDKVYKLIEFDGERIVMEVSSPEPALLHVRFVNATPRKSTRMALSEYVWEWFDLGRDLTPFYRMAKKDPLLKELIDKYFGLRIVGIPDLFEALCWAIIGQQINLNFAYTLKRRFVEVFGESMKWEDQTYFLFPRPEYVTNLSVHELLEIQLTAKKSEYILDVAKRMAEGILTKNGLMRLDHFKDVENKLLNIRGIGPWTANYVMMRCLRDSSAFPIADAGLHNAIKQQLNLDRKPTIDEIRQLAERWKNWEAYATFYLWRSLYG